MMRGSPGISDLTRSYAFWKACRRAPASGVPLSATRLPMAVLSWSGEVLPTVQSMVVVTVPPY